MSLLTMIGLAESHAQNGAEFCQQTFQPLSVGLGCGHPCFANVHASEIESYPLATIALDFHFVADANGNNFHCDPNGNATLFAPAIAAQIMNRANVYFSAPDQNQHGPSPQVPDARIRYELYGNPANACDVMFFYAANEPVVFSNTGAFHIVVKNQNPPKSSVNGELTSESSMNLLNIQYAFFVNGSTDAGEWGPIMNHEIGHRFGLCHSFSSENSCPDMDPAVECGGPSASVCEQNGMVTPCPQVPNNSPYPLSCGGNTCFSCYCTWGSGNNFMGSNGIFRGMTVSQWATMYGNMLTEKPAFVRFDGTQCTDIPPHAPLEIPENTVVEWNTFRFLDRHVEVRKGATLIITCDVLVGKNISIIVNRGARLFVLGGRITSKTESCRWDGIIVHGNSALEQPGENVAKDYNSPLNENGSGVVWLNGAKLENAHTAISTRGTGGLNTSAYYGGLVLAYDTDFINNDRGVEFMAYGKSNKSKFEYCNFVKGPNAVPFPVRRGVTIWACRDIKFRHSNFLDLTESGISGINFSSEVEESCDFKGSLYGYRSEVTMPNVSKGITTIQESTFRNNRFHIWCNASPNYLYGYNILDNTLLNGQLFGIRIAGEAQYRIAQENVFEKHIVAVSLITTGSHKNEVYCNYFAPPSQMDINVRFRNDQLHIRGNYFLGTNGQPIRLDGNSNPIDPTDLTQMASVYEKQGDESASAGNVFFKPNSAIVADQNGTITFKYYTVPEPPANELPTNNLSDNGTNDYQVRKESVNRFDCPDQFFSPNPPTEADLDTARQITATLRAVWEADNLNQAKRAAYLNATVQQDAILRRLVYDAWLADSNVYAEYLLLGEHTNTAIRGVVGMRVLRGDLAGAQTLLDSMPIANQDDQWFKDIMAINLDIADSGAEGFDLSVAQEQTLHTIAAVEHSLMRGYACALLSQWRGYTCTEELPEGLIEGEEREGKADKLPAPLAAQVYPNPANAGVLHVRYADLIGERLYLELFNSSGQIVQRTEFQNTGNTALPIGHLPDGAYWLRLYHSSRVVHTGKIVVLH